MSFAMQKLRALLPTNAASSSAAAQRHSVVLEPEIGFQITIEPNAAQAGTQATVPELTVHLIAARHLPTLFGFKIVQGYLIKVKLFPGSKRLDSSIHTNSWPKFNENFKFPLAPDIKPSLKHVAMRRSQVSELHEQQPGQLFAGQFVVFTVYALLELPPASFNRFNKTYRSLRDKSSNLVQKVIDSSGSTPTAQANKDGATNGHSRPGRGREDDPSGKNRKSSNPRDSMPPLTISESRRNIGTVTCYLEPKLFKRNARTGVYTTEELWQPVKDITTTIAKGPSNNNNLTNAPKGVVEIVLELHDLSENSAQAAPSTSAGNGNPQTQHAASANGSAITTTTTAATTTATDTPLLRLQRQQSQTESLSSWTPTPPAMANGNVKWQRMTSEMKRKIGISNHSLNSGGACKSNLVLRITTARMRCSNKVKDELECTAGSVYVKTTVFEYDIYIDAWKSANFYPSLSTKWDVREGVATMEVPLQSLDSLENILIRTTLATKSKLGKKLVLGTVLIGAKAPGSGIEQIMLLSEAAFNDRIAMWHQFQ